jgi:hypothetical protein
MTTSSRIPFREINGVNNRPTKTKKILPRRREAESFFVVGRGGPHTTIQQQRSANAAPTSHGKGGKSGQWTEREDRVFKQEVGRQRNQDGFNGSYDWLALSKAIKTRYDGCKGRTTDHYFLYVVANYTLLTPCRPPKLSIVEHAPR